MPTSATRILRTKCGFEPNEDYHVVTTGGTDKRYEDLISGKPDSDMVVIHTGLPERAEAKSVNGFGTMLPDAVSAYAGVVATATHQWLDSHGDVAGCFLRAIKRGAGSWLTQRTRRKFLPYFHRTEILRPVSIFIRYS